LQNAPFFPIPASGSNFNPQNTQCIPACPVGPADRTGVVKIFAFLAIEPRLNIKYGFNWAGKIERFSKVSLKYVGWLYNNEGYTKTYEKVNMSLCYNIV
jgi:hypothetical protein